MKVLNESLLTEVLNRIVGKVHPEKIYLFGSHTYGIPHENSDVDLLVIVSDTSIPSHKHEIQIYRVLRGLFLPIEIRVDTRTEFERRSKWLNSIERIANEKGKILYEPHP